MPKTEKRANNIPGAEKGEDLNLFYLFSITFRSCRPRWRLTKKEYLNFRLVVKVFHEWKL